MFHGDSFLSRALEFLVSRKCQLFQDVFPHQCVYFFLLMFIKGGFYAILNKKTFSAFTKLKTVTVTRLRGAKGGLWVEQYIYSLSNSVQSVESGHYSNETFLQLF